MTNVPQQPPYSLPKAAAVTSNSRPVVVFNCPEGIEARVGWWRGGGGKTGALPQHMAAKKKKKKSGLGAPGANRSKSVYSARVDGHFL